MPVTERTLFDPPERDDLSPGTWAPMPRRSIQERFEAWIARNKEVYDLFKQFAFDLKKAGHEKGGAKAIAERIRWHYATEGPRDGEFKLNNIFVSRLARMLIAECPQFEHFFKRRKIKTP